VSKTSDSPEARRRGTTDVRIRSYSRFAMWRRRHLNARSVVALIALLSLLAPGVAAIIDAAI
jgi:hypothetical protein